jgi:threonine dehydratase
MYQSQKAGRPVEAAEVPTLADALGRIGFDNRYTFAMVRELVDDLVLVSEEQIADAIRHAYFAEKQVIERSGAVGIAAARRSGRGSALPRWWSAAATST